jgi:hypothetical protein
VIRLAQLRGEDVSKQMAELAALELEYARMTTKGVQDENAKKVKNSKEAFEKIGEAIQQVQGYYNQVTGMIGDIIQASTDKQKNAIQDLIDAGDKKAQHEIEAVNASALSEQEKAAKITIINARTQANKEQLERRQRQLDLQRARFEKNAAIGTIIINTALAVSKTLATLGVPAGIPAAIIAGALGAAQLAIAIAQPLPRFAKGTDNAPGGAAIVGDAGVHEYVVTPEGKLAETPRVPTVMNIPKGSIIFPNKRALLESAVNPRNGGSVMNKRDDKNELIEILGGKMDKLISVVKNKREITITNSRDGWKQFARDGNNFSTYINNKV